MIQRICPICDQVMESAHYCRHCKRWVKHPHMVEMTYRLNEQHPRQEADCSYHLPIPKQEPEKKVKPQTDKARTGKRSSGKGALVVVGIVALLKLITSFTGIVTDTVSEVFEEVVRGVPEYDIDMGDYTDEAWEDYVELTDDEVLALGEACNSRGHFPILGDGMIFAAQDRIKDIGYTVTSTQTTSYNERYDDGETWYGTWTDIELTDEENPNDYQYLQFDYDTATGMLHEVTISLKDPEKQSEASCMLMDLLIEQGGMEPYSESRASIREALFHAISDRRGWQMEQGDVWMEGVSYDTRYSVTISHNMISD